MSVASVLKRRSRVEILFLALAVLWVLLSLAHIATGVSAFIGLVEFFLGVFLAFRLARYLARQSIWRLRNRLIVTELFIGVTPVVLILALVVIGGYFIAGQVAVFLVSSELDRRIDALNEPAQILAWSSADTSERIMKQVQPFVLNHFPNVRMLLHGDRDLIFPLEQKLVCPPKGWRDSKGLLVKGGRYYGWAHVVRDRNEVVLLEPITNNLLSQLVPNLGQVLLTAEEGNTKTFVSSSGERSVNYLPAAINFFDREVTWLAHLKVAEWEKPNVVSEHDLVVTTRPSALIHAIFSDQFEVGQLSLYVLYAVMITFLIVELLSLVAGISLTRSITGAVHSLYEGTQKVTAGDFSHRIQVRGRDQLSALSASFNSMSENIERLFAVEKEKERLQSELEIAKDVQAQLFPKDVPELKTMQLTGLCKPARMVSGDYYDFFCLEDRRIAVAIGDVAGKGMSAALLMAAIQSIMRAQLTHTEGPGCVDTSRAVSLLNRQLYANTSPEKYATFWFGIYDEGSRILSYTNAGHLPPMLVRDGAAELLDVTGTVVGAFPKSKYEERKIALRPGDLLVGYTDGIAEPENEYGEQFGEERLVDLLLRYQTLDTPEIIARVMEAVEQWTHASELPDDMTLLIAKLH